jgi:GxxExxY protein
MERGVLEARRIEKFGELTEQIIGCAIKVHSELGPGLPELAYESALAIELFDAGLKFEQQVAVAIQYKGRPLGVGYRLDLVIENSVVIELKAVESIAAVHRAQLLSYLRLSGCTLGLLINFNVVSLREGVRRVVNSRPSSTPKLRVPILKAPQ